MADNSLFPMTLIQMVFHVKIPMAESWSRSAGDGKETALIEIGAVPSGEGWVSDKTFWINLPEAVEEALTKVVEKYDQPSGEIYLERCTRPHTQAPWAFITFPRECQILGHLRQAREAFTDELGLCPYSEVPSPMPDGYTPGIGTILVFSKAALLLAHQNSEVLSLAWTHLERFHEDQQVLCMINELPEPWLTETENKDHSLVEVQGGI